MQYKLYVIDFGSSEDVNRVVQSFLSDLQFLKSLKCNGSASMAGGGRHAWRTATALLVMLGIFAVQSHMRDSAALAGLVRTRLELEQQLAQLDDGGWGPPTTGRGVRDARDAADAGGSAAAALHRLRRDRAIVLSAAAVPPPPRAAAPLTARPPPPPPLLPLVLAAALTSLVPLRGERDFECPGRDEMRSSGGCQIACRSGSNCASAVALCESLAAPPSSCRRVAINAEGTWATLKREGPVEAASPPGETPDAVFLSTDFHIATIADVKWTFRDMCRSRDRSAAAPHAPSSTLCAHVVDHSFSGACGLTAGGRVPTCATPRVMHPLDASNGLTLCPRPYALRAAFFEKFKHAGRCVGVHVGTARRALRASASCRGAAGSCNCSAQL